MLGKAHPDTLTAMANLASTLGNQGKLDDAAKLLTEAYDAMKRRLGTEHPITLWAMSLLAAVYQEQGMLYESVTLLQKVVDASSRILGGEHPDTQERVRNLKSLCRTLAQSTFPIMLC
jgi:hypothetical protein